MPEPSPLVVVLTAILSGERVCLLRRRKPPYRGFWSLPGGKIHFGETIPDGALREAEEETGLPLRFERLCGVSTETIRDASGAPEAHFVLFLALLRAEGEDVRAGPEGSLAWFPADALPEEMIPTDRILFESLTDRNAELPVRHFTVSREGEAFRLISSG